MVEIGQEVKLEFEPVYVPETEIIIPLKRVPVEPTIPYIPTPISPEKNRLIINIETSGFNPLENRIISIGIQDPLMTDQKPIVIMLDDEAAMLNALFTVIKENNYNEIVGYGLSFDYRFILLRAMYHNIDCKEFYDMELYDLMQAVAQGKFKFVYFPQKALKLSDVSDFFWGYPKPFTDLEMLKYWKSGQLDKVVEFTSSQVTRILALYLLFRKVSESSFIPSASVFAGVSSIPSVTTPEITGSKLTIPEAHAPQKIKYKCESCLAEFEVTADQTMTQCTICGQPVKRV